MSVLSTLRALFTFGRGVFGGLDELRAGEDPVALFAAWFEAARKSGFYLPESMSLATADAAGRPSVRMVLLKGFDESGFVFYTNYESRKARDLAENPWAALCLHWNVLQRQVRVRGPVSKVTSEESEAYFRTRPRGSRVGAWASRQSSELPDRAELERRYAELERRYAGEEVPLPEFWGGYRVVPEVMEFWQGRANRLHDRLEYRRDDAGWSVRRLYP
jgi:pyridoxamine 5'-phosphate oxidase